MWETATGKLAAPPFRHGGRSTRALAFSADGRIVVTGGTDSTVQQWNVATGQPMSEALRPPSAVLAVALSPDGKTVLIGCIDRSAQLWDTGTGRPRGEPLRHTDQITVVAFSPDGRIVVTGSFDRTARLWDAATGKPLTEPLRHGGAQGGPICAAVFSDDLDVHTVHHPIEAFEQSSSKVRLERVLFQMFAPELVLPRCGRLLRPSIRQPVRHREIMARVRLHLSQSFKHRI